MRDVAVVKELDSFDRTYKLHDDGVQSEPTLGVVVHLSLRAVTDPHRGISPNIR